MLAETVKTWPRQWREEGRQEGRQEGLREMLRLLIEEKFGPVPRDQAARIAAASDDEIARWATRTLRVSSLEEIFQD